jgi:hypothetical protein
MTFLGNGSVFTISGGNPDSTDNFGFGFFQVGARVGDVLNKDAFFFFRIPVKTPDLKPEPKEEATPDFGQWTVSGRGYKVSGQDTVLGGASFDSNDFPDATIIVLDEGSPKFNPSPEPSAKVLFAPACLALLAYCWKASRYSSKSSSSRRMGVSPVGFG